jgi:hypothetical protein
MYSGYNFYDRPLAQRQVTQVSDANSAWYAQEPHWILIEDLMGGTYGMRRKHRRYLPQEPRELDESYDNRLARSVVAPYYQRLERMLAGMLTRKPVRLEDTSDIITEQLFDVDQQGNDLNVWTYTKRRASWCATATSARWLMHHRMAVDRTGLPTRQDKSLAGAAKLKMASTSYQCCGYQKPSPSQMVSTAKS